MKTAHPEITRAPSPARASEPATLETVERRRSELLRVTFLILILLAVGTVVASFAEQGLSWFDDFGGTVNILRGSLIALCFGFAGYVFDKERRLKKMAKDLTNERVVSAALENRLREIAYLTEAGKAVFSSLELEEVLQAILDASFELLEADEGSILLLEGSELVATAASGYAETFLGSRYSTENTIAGHAVRTRSSVRILGDEEGAPGRLRRRGALSSSMSVPLLVGDAAIGALNLGRHPGSPTFEEYDLRALERFAEHAALAVRNAQAYGQRRNEGNALTANAAKNLESSLAMILGTVGLLGGDGDDVAGRHREALGTIGRRAEGILVEMEDLFDRVPALPAESGSEEETVQAASEPSVRRRAERHRVLVADDDPVLLRLFGSGLERYGHDVILASDGAAALRRIEQERPDVVVLDLVMPVMDGWQVLAQLAERPSGPRVLVVSGRAQEGDRQRAVEAGAHAFLAKPFAIDELERAVLDAANRTDMGAATVHR